MASRGTILHVFLLATLACSLCNGRHGTAFLPSRRISSSDLSPSPTITSTIPVLASSSSSSSKPSTILLQQSSGNVGSIPSGGGGESSSPPIVYEKVDWAALGKYSVGLVAQVSLLFGFLTAIDQILAHHYFSSVKVPFAANVIFLYVFNLKSSLFSILPSSSSEERYTKRNRPSWTPPGIAFVFGWPLLTFGLRAYTGAMVVQASGGRYASAALMSLMLHFSVGNLWNTVYVCFLFVEIIIIYAALNCIHLFSYC